MTPDIQARATGEPPKKPTSAFGSLCASVETIARRLLALEQRPEAKDGRDGRDADPAVVAQIVADIVAKIPPATNGRDGVDGRDGKVDPIFLAQLVSDAVAKIPAPQNGRDGKDGSDGRDAIDGRDGKDAVIPLAPDDVADQVARAISIVAESPQIVAKSSVAPITLNIAAPSERRKAKTITTRKDENGNMVAEVIEREID